MGFSDNNPTDDWADWGVADSTPQSSNESWDNPTDSNEGSFVEQESGWDDWGGSSENTNQDTWNDNNGGFINQNSSEQSWDTSDSTETFDDELNNNPVQETAPVQFNMSTKKVAFILAGAILLLAVLFMFIDKAHLKKNTTTQTSNVTQQEVSNNTSSESTNSSSSTTTNTSADSVVLVEIPASTSLNYSGDVLTANGTVTAKTKYVQGHQVLYCVTINLVFGASSESINYYCNYASYNAVSTGDVVVVTYQQVEDSYISVNAISK